MTDCITVINKLSSFIIIVLWKTQNLLLSFGQFRLLWLTKKNGLDNTCRAFVIKK